MEKFSTRWYFTPASPFDLDRIARVPICFSFAVRTIQTASWMVAISALCGGFLYAQDDAEKVDMAPPDSIAGNVYARGMSAILSHLESDITYDRVMGLTGVAFILQIDTSGPHVAGELDCAWWPNDDWGFELGLPILSQAVGRKISRLSCDVDAYKTDPAAEYRRAFGAAVEQSIDSGKPVLSYGLVGTAVDGDTPPLLGYRTKGTSTRFGQQVERAAEHPWNLYVIGDKTTSASTHAVELASLRHIINLFDEKAQGPGAPETRFSGHRAWVEWLRLLENGTGADNNMLLHLRYSRQCAVNYLRDMAQRHTGTTAELLQSASDHYQHALDELMKQDLPYNRVSNGEPEETVYRDYAAMIERVSKLEADALAQIRAAAEYMAEQHGPRMRKQTR